MPLGVIGSTTPSMPTISRIVATIGVLALLTAPASAKIERVVEKSFQVQPGVHLRVSTAGGDVHVTTSSDLTVRVTAKEHIRAGSEAEADELLKKLDLSIEQSGNEVAASASYSSSVGFHFGSWPPVQVDFYVTVPASASADLKTSGGDIVVGDLGGSVRAHTSGGDVKLGSIGGEIDATTSGGNIALEEGRGGVRLSTSGGNVSARHILGPSNLKTSGGDIRVDQVEGTLDAQTSGGDVKAGFGGALKGDCLLSTSGGEVRATLGKEVGFRLDASTSGGEVNAAGLTITIDRGGTGRSSLAGLVNGGGPLLKLRSSGGNIDVAVR
jgi:DUF4097 and DUF4098 domain-containing protein YvlB